MSRKELERRVYLWPGLVLCLVGVLSLIGLGPSGGGITPLCIGVGFVSMWVLGRGRQPE